jgi:UDP-N-acetylmuramoyl-tripeptide--D-alanyl-D-alanine ligase
MKAFISQSLGNSAKRVIKREHPEIVGITGSVGKTSTKDAIATVLSGAFDIRSTPGNLNTEFGVPLAILGFTEPAHSPLGWATLALRAWFRSFAHEQDFPGTFVLEMAADRPGDIAYLCDIAPPKIGVVTAVSESHHEKFGSIDEVEKEKRTLVERLPDDGVAILNHDDDRVWRMRERTKAKVVSFGLAPGADVRAVETSMEAKETASECGVHIKVQSSIGAMSVFIPGTLGRHAVNAVLAAAAVGIVKGMPLDRIVERLRMFRPPAGRMRCLEGIKRTLLIDDTYNAAPKSVNAALDVVQHLSVPGKKIIVLGDMLELGSVSIAAHEEVGRAAVDAGADLIVFVGERMGDAHKAALADGAPAESVFHFGSTAEAGRFVQERLGKGDMVLVKGSRGMHMEAVVKELMAEPLKAGELLVQH